MIIASNSSPRDHVPKSIRDRDAIARDAEVDRRRSLFRQARGMSNALRTITDRQRHGGLTRADGAVLAVMVLQNLRACVRRERIYVPTRAYLAGKTGFTERTVSKSLARLKLAGIIVAVRYESGGRLLSKGKGLATEYRSGCLQLLGDQLRGLGYRLPPQLAADLADLGAWAARQVGEATQAASDRTHTGKFVPGTLMPSDTAPPSRQTAARVADVVQASESGVQRPPLSPLASKALTAAQIAKECEMPQDQPKARLWRKADGKPLDQPAPPIILPSTDPRQANLFWDGPNAGTPGQAGNRMYDFSFCAPGAGLADATDAERAMHFMHGLAIPEGPNAGKPVDLAPFQRSFIEGALAPETANAVLSIGRGNGKSAITAGLGLGGLLGIWDRQPRREIVAAARTRDQGKVIYQFAAGFCESLPVEIQRQLTFRRSPRLEIEFEGDGGGHVLRVIAADGKSALGGAPTIAILDERGHWALDRGDELEHALLSGLGKRGGRAFLISTSAADDTHPFSRWIDEPTPGTFVQEHRPAPSLPVDDRESLLIANPGSEHGIGASIDWLEEQAQRAIARGGSALSTFRLYNRNERVSGENRDLLITVDEWLACETDALPPRHGGVVVGIDLGGSASMTAAALYWPETGRLEALGTFPGAPSLLDRGQRDGVARRYEEMRERGELTTLGDKTVPVAAWFGTVMERIAGQSVLALVMDRYKQAELGEAIDRAGIRAPLVWRGQGFRDGGEDAERFRRAAFDGQIKAAPSILLRNAFADTVCLRDPANNIKIAKARSTGRIDAAAATVLAVAEGVRSQARPAAKGGRVLWA